MIELSVESVIDFNEDCCAATAENHAVLDRGGLEAAVARPWSGFGDFEPFPTIYDKAGALLHALASRQVFENGNKRTAWLAATTLLKVNGVDTGHVPTIQADALVRAVSVDHNFAEADAAEWLREIVRHQKVGYAKDPRFEYLLLAGSSTIDDPTDGYSLMNAHLHTVVPEVTPTPYELILATRIHWLEEDLGAEHLLRVHVEQQQTRVITPLPNRLPWVVQLMAPIVAGHAHHRFGIVPSIVSMPLRMSIVQPGSSTIVVALDDVEVGRLPLHVALQGRAPDSPLSLFG